MNEAMDEAKREQQLAERSARWWAYVSAIRAQAERDRTEILQLKEDLGRLRAMTRRWRIAL